MEIKDDVTAPRDFNAQMKYQKHSQGLLGGEVKEVSIFSGEDMVFTSRANKVIFIVRGQVECNIEGYPAEILHDRCLFFARIGVQCIIKAKKDSKLLFMRSGSAAEQKDSIAQAYHNGVMANAVENDLLNQPEKHLPVLPFNTYIRHFTV